MIFEDELPLKKKVTHHEVGCDLYAISVQELDERIAVLMQEISRLENEKMAKLNSVSAANSFFKK